MCTFRVWDLQQLSSVTLVFLRCGEELYSWLDSGVQYKAEGHCEYNVEGRENCLTLRVYVVYADVLRLTFLMMQKGALHDRQQIIAIDV